MSGTPSGEDIDCGRSASYRFLGSNTPVRRFPGPILDIDHFRIVGKERVNTVSYPSTVEEGTGSK